MNKLILYAIAIMAMVGSVFAAEQIITPDLVGMEPSDSKDVEVCIYKADGSAYAGLDLSVTGQCKDLDGNEACDASEQNNAVGEFSAEVIDSPTGEDGCGTVRLTTTDASATTYAYMVNSYDSGASVEVTQETGIALVPEFGIIGAGLVLAVAGIFIARRRA